MSSGSPIRTTAVLLATVIALGACGEAGGAERELPEVATVEAAEDGGSAVITLSEAAERRLGMATVPVAQDPAGLVVPYAALVYDTDGTAAVFVRTEPLTYQRTPVTVAAKSGDRVVLAAGPPAGTEVVIVGSAELVGVETGIDGEE